MGIPKNTIEKFWNCVGKGDGCWMWAGSCTPDGYGKFKLNGKFLRSHRIAYEAAKGKIPDGMVVMHKCDTPRCCNPDHLTVGTNAENVKDAINKGRRPAVTLTEKEQRYVKHLYFAERHSMKQLSAFFKASVFVIHRIVHGHIYRREECPAAT